MPEQWRWSERRRTVLLLGTLGWLIYIAGVTSVVLFLLPPVATQDALVVGGTIVILVGPPAWIHFNWVCNPAYLFVANDIRRLHVSRYVEAQVSRSVNRTNELGVPMLPADLRTDSVDLRGEAEADRVKVGAWQVTWDTPLYVATRLLDSRISLPRRTIRASVELREGKMVVSAGSWRPGVVLELPYAMIVGLWNGRDVPTIGSDDVVVVVADSGRDELLFPLQVARSNRGSKRSKRAVADELLHSIAHALRS